MDLSKFIDESKELLELETLNMVKLEGDKLNAFKIRMGMKQICGEVYANRFNLLLTQDQDYEIFKYLCKDDEKIIKLEIREYNTSFYVIRYINNYLINDALRDVVFDSGQQLVFEF